MVLVLRKLVGRRSTLEWVAVSVPYEQDQSLEKE